MKAIKPECLFLSDTVGPFHTIEQCLDRNKKIFNDSKRVLPMYRLANAECRLEHGTKYMARIHPTINA